MAEKEQLKKEKDDLAYENLQIKLQKENDNLTKYKRMLIKTKFNQS